MKILPLFLLTVWLLAGCFGGGNGAPEPEFYLLRADVQLPDGPQAPAVTVGIARVSIADYLGQAGIVVASSDDKVRPARQYLWAEPLDSSIRLFLRDAISAELGYPVYADTAKRLSWDYKIDIRIDELHGSLEGDVKILAFWNVIDVSHDTEVVRHRFERMIGMTDDGYDALVESEKILLSGLAAAISASLKGIE
jgi:uncharacterized lipoprotein YmbA